MELWIRSQDKCRLVPKPNLYAVFDKDNNIAYIGEDEERPIKEGVMNFRENQWCVNKKHLDGFTMRMYTREVIGNIYEGRSE